MRMLHQRQRLLFGFEAGDDPLGVHARLDDFEGYLPSDGLLLLGQVHDPHAAFAQHRQQLITTDLAARRLH